MALDHENSIHGVGEIIVIIVARTSCLIGLAIPIDIQFMESIVPGIVFRHTTRIVQSKMGMADLHLQYMQGIRRCVDVDQSYARISD